MPPGAYGRGGKLFLGQALKGSHSPLKGVGAGRLPARRIDKLFRVRQQLPASQYTKGTRVLKGRVGTEQGSKRWPPQVLIT